MNYIRQGTYTLKKILNAQRRRHQMPSQGQTSVLNSATTSVPSKVQNLRNLFGQICSHFFWANAKGKFL